MVGDFVKGVVNGFEEDEHLVGFSRGTPGGKADDIAKHNGRAGKEVGNWLYRKVRLGHVVVVLLTAERALERTRILVILCHLLHELLLHGLGKKRRDNLGSSHSLTHQPPLATDYCPVVDQPERKDSTKDAHNDESVGQRLVRQTLRLERCRCVDIQDVLAVPVICTVEVFGVADSVNRRVGWSCELYKGRQASRIHVAVVSRIMHITATEKHSVHLVDLGREDATTLVVDDNDYIFNVFRKDIFEVSFPGEDRDDERDNLGVTVKSLEVWLDKVALEMIANIFFDRVLSEVAVVGDRRQDTFSLLNGIHHRMFERRASHEIQVDDTCVQRRTGHLPDWEEVAVDMDCTFLVRLVLIDIIFVDLLRNRTRIDIQQALVVETLLKPILLGDGVLFPAPLFARLDHGSKENNFST